MDRRTNFEIDIKVSSVGGRATTCRGIHMVLFFLVIDTVVVLVLTLLEQTLVAASVVGCSWRSVHVILVAPHGTVTLGQLFLGVLVKT